MGPENFFLAPSTVSDGAGRGFTVARAGPRAYGDALQSSRRLGPSFPRIEGSGTQRAEEHSFGASTLESRFYETLANGH